MNESVVETQEGNTRTGQMVDSQSAEKEISEAELTAIRAQAQTSLSPAEAVAYRELHSKHS